MQQLSEDARSPPDNGCHSVGLSEVVTLVGLPAGAIRQQ